MYIAHRLLDSTVLSILRPQVRILNSPKSKVAPVFRNYYAMILTLKALLLWFVPFWSSLACFGRKKCLLSWPLWVCNVVSSSHPRQRAQQRSFFQSNFQSFSFRVDRSSFPDSVTAKRNYSPTPPHRGVDVIKRFFEGNIDFPKIKKLKRVWSDVWTCTQMWKQNNAIFKQN